MRRRPRASKRSETGQLRVLVGTVDDLTPRSAMAWPSGMPRGALTRALPLDGCTRLSMSPTPLGSLPQSAASRDDWATADRASCWRP